jgi:hypothetical protein
MLAVPKGPPFLGDDDGEDPADGPPKLADCSTSDEGEGNDGGPGCDGGGIARGTAPEESGGDAVWEDSRRRGPDLSPRPLIQGHTVSGALGAASNPAWRARRTSQQPRTMWHGKRRAGGLGAAPLHTARPLLLAASPVASRHPCTRLPATRPPSPPAPLTTQADVCGIAWHPWRPHKFATACASPNVYVWHARHRGLIVRGRVGRGAGCGAQHSQRCIRQAAGAQPARS